MIYILTGDKKGDTYQYIFNVVKFYFDQNCPVETGTIMIDFEKALMNAIQNSLPGWEISQGRIQRNVVGGGGGVPELLGVRARRREALAEEAAAGVWGRKNRSPRVLECT